MTRQISFQALLQKPTTLILTCTLKGQKHDVSHGHEIMKVSTTKIYQLQMVLIELSKLTPTQQFATEIYTRMCMVQSFDEKKSHLFRAIKSSKNWKQKCSLG